MDDQKILIYTKRKTNRQLFVFQLFLKDIMGLNFGLVTDPEIFRVYKGPKFSYNETAIADEMFISSSEILFDRGIQKYDLSFSTYLDLPCFFNTFNKKSLYRFDLFAASFYLVTRYEEYLPFIKDRFGRFTAQESLALQQGFLHKPLVNIWILDFAEKLKNAFPHLHIKNTKYNFVPTIDIDAAYAYKYKGFWRIVGGFIKNFRDKEYKDIKQRTRVLRGKENDPFDTFDRLIDLHKTYNLDAIYFILFAIYNEYDKNTPTSSRKFQTLIRRLADYSEVGIHPSFASSLDFTKVKSEIEMLGEVIHDEITQSRQHFLMLHLPQTYHELINNGIKHDYTMGYSDKPGFRAGICTPYYFYDIESEQLTSLMIHPFTVMEGTLKDYMQLDIEDSKKIIFELIDEVRKVNGTFISLWHNESMSNQKRWVGWDKLYEEVIQYAIPSKTKHD